MPNRIEIAKRSLIVFILTAICGTHACLAENPKGKPNVVFVFADQWRSSASGHAGDPNVRTPNLDRLAQESLNFENAVSVCPVCGPARAAIMTGQYPLSSGFFVNDVTLNQKGPSIAEAFSAAGYMTGLVGKWHLDGNGRSNYIPEERRQGFKYFKAIECPPDHNNTIYYEGNRSTPEKWDGYDPYDQTRSAIRFMRTYKDRPFFLVLSWNPPHAPYLNAPKRFNDLYDPQSITLAPNVPSNDEDFAGVNKWAELPGAKGRDRVRKLLAGYYGHCSALDACIGNLQNSIRKLGLEENTIFVFTSDHGDMLGSHGLWKKQQPYDESIRIPSLFKIPKIEASTVSTPINLPDIMPTLLGLCGIDIPQSVEGIDYTPQIRSGKWKDTAALIANYQPFGQWPMGPHYDGWPNSRIGKEWRGVRTSRYTYVRDLGGPWLLFDNQTDPYQLENLVGQTKYAFIQSALNEALNEKLEMTRDDFQAGINYMERMGYKYDKSGSVIYSQ